MEFQFYFGKYNSTSKKNYTAHLRYEYVNIRGLKYPQ